jgi:hypothetical protein
MQTRCTGPDHDLETVATQLGMQAAEIRPGGIILCGKQMTLSYVDTLYLKGRDTIDTLQSCQQYQHGQQASKSNTSLHYKTDKTEPVDTLLSRQQQQRSVCTDLKPAKAT